MDDPSVGREQELVSQRLASGSPLTATCRVYLWRISESDATLPHRSRFVAAWIQVRRPHADHLLPCALAPSLPVLPGASGRSPVTILHRRSPRRRRVSHALSRPGAIIE